MAIACTLVSEFAFESVRVSQSSKTPVIRLPSLLRFPHISLDNVLSRITIVAARYHSYRISVMPLKSPPPSTSPWVHQRVITEHSK